MKRASFLLFSTLFAYTLSAQMWNGRDSIFGNEWIKEGQSYYKINIATDGVFRITGATLRTLGVPISSVTGSQFQLFKNGEEVTIFTSSNGNFADNDFVEFYGQYNRSEVDVHLFKNGLKDLLNPEYSLITDTAAYFLTWSTTPSVKRYQSTINDLTNLPSKDAWYWHTSNQVFKSASIKNGLNSSNDVYLCEYNSGEGYGTAMQREQSFTISPQNAVTSVNGQLTVRYAGNTSAHINHLTLNTDTVRIDTNFTYTDFVRTLTASVDGAKLSSNLTFKIRGAFNNLDLNTVSNISLKYARPFNFNNTNYFEFEVSASNDRKYVEIDNFRASSVAPILLDVTNNLRIATTLQGSTVRVVLPPSVTNRKLVLVSAA
ncbi:MAG TPA: hypothetical protein V6C58_19840, partial [Allocoleopsis sp.]